MISKLLPPKSVITDNINKTNNILPRENALQCPPFRMNDNCNIDISTRQKKEIVPKTLPDIIEKNRPLSKFLFERRLSANEDSCHTCPVCSENPKSPSLKTNVPQQKCDTGIQVAKHIGEWCTTQKKDFN